MEDCLIPLEGKQLKNAPFRQGCQVYVMEGRHEEKMIEKEEEDGRTNNNIKSRRRHRHTPHLQITHRATITNVFLQMESARLLFEVTACQEHAEEKAAATGKNERESTRTCSARKSMMVTSERLRYRNGCPVYVRCPTGTSSSTNSSTQNGNGIANGNNTKSKLKGIILGWCDIPSDDDHSKYTPDTFWYSVQILHDEDEDVEEENSNSTILHQISRKDVSLREEEIDDENEVVEYDHPTFPITAENDRHRENIVATPTAPDVVGGKEQSTSTSAVPMMMVQEKKEPREEESTRTAQLNPAEQMSNEETTAIIPCTAEVSDSGSELLSASHNHHHHQQHMSIKEECNDDYDGIDGGRHHAQRPSLESNPDPNSNPKEAQGSSDSTNITEEGGHTHDVQEEENLLAMMKSPTCTRPISETTSYDIRQQEHQNNTNDCSSGSSTFPTMTTVERDINDGVAATTRPLYSEYLYGKGEMKKEAVSSDAAGNNSSDSAPLGGNANIKEEDGNDDNDSSIDDDESLFSSCSSEPKQTECERHACTRKIKAEENDGGDTNKFTSSPFSHHPLESRLTGGLDLDLDDSYQWSQLNQGVVSDAINADQDGSIQYSQHNRDQVWKKRKLDDNHDSSRIHYNNLDTTMMANNFNWKIIPPSSSEPCTKIINGIEYHWCRKCNRGQWGNHREDEHRPFDHTPPGPGESHSRKAVYGAMRHWCSKCNSGKGGWSTHIEQLHGAQPPEPGEPHSIEVNGMTFHWCGKCSRGSGLWGAHKEEEHFDRSKPPELGESHSKKNYNGTILHWCGKCRSGRGEWGAHKEEEHFDFFKPPDEGESHSKKNYNGKILHWCGKCRRGEGRWGAHKEKEHFDTSKPPDEGESHSKKNHNGTMLHWCSKCDDGRGKWVDHTEQQHRKVKKRRLVEDDLESSTQNKKIRQTSTVDMQQQVSCLPCSYTSMREDQETKSSIVSSNVHGEEDGNRYRDNTAEDGHLDHKRGKSKSKRDSIKPDINPNYHCDIFQRFKDHSKYYSIADIKKMRMDIPQSFFNPSMPSCLGYHVNGICHSNCKMAEDHLPLSFHERQKLERWCESNLSRENIKCWHLSLPSNKRAYIKTSDVRAIVVGVKGSNRRKLLEKSGCISIGVHKNPRRGGCLIQVVHESNIGARNCCVNILKLLREVLGPLSDANIKCAR